MFLSKPNVYREIEADEGTMAMNFHVHLLELLPYPTLKSACTLLQ